MTMTQTQWIADDAVDKDKINADVAGAGLVQAAGGELDVNVDDASIEVAADVVQVKALGVGTSELAATSVTAAKLGSDVAGDGLTGGNGADLDVDPDATGGANLARAVNVSANGVAVKIDDTTVGEDGSQRLQVKGNSIGATQVDETDSYTWVTGSHDFTGVGSISVKTPTSDAHAATKAYVDAARAGVAAKSPSRAMADSNQTLSGLPGTIDGVTTWIDNQRILLTGQSTGSQNGIWEVHAGAWTRPNDFDTGDSAAGAQTWINEGTSYGDTQRTCTDDSGSDVIDTDALTFVQTSGAGAVTAGTGLTKTANTIDVGDGSTGDINGINRTADNIAAAVDNSSIEIATNVLAIKALGVGTTELAATSVTAAKLGSDVAGNGLTGGNGSAIAALDDATGGANLAKVVNVSANGLAARVDASTIDENGSAQLGVPNAGITETQLNSSVAGVGISGGAGSALALDINGLTAEAAADNADMIAIYDDSGAVTRKQTRGNFLSGTAGESGELEMHLITAGETTAGYFTLTTTPIATTSVRGTPVGGPEQVNKQVVGATGATPDFDVLSSDQFHFNNNGAATGLSGDMTTGDIIIVRYES
jgi:hypothetical protein